MRGRLALLILVFVQNILFGQWGNSKYLNDLSDDNHQIVPLISTSWLGSQQFVSNQSLGLFSKKEWNKKFRTLSYLGTEIFNKGLLPQHQVRSINGKQFSPVYGRAHTVGKWNIAPILRFYTQYKLHPSFGLYAGYDSRHFGHYFDRSFRDRQSTPTPYIGYAYQPTDNIVYNFQLDYANNDGIFGNTEMAKYLATHTLSFSYKNFLFNFFESVVWRRENENGHRGIEPLYLTPAAIFRPAEFSLGSSDNVLLGAGFRYSVIKKEKWKPTHQKGVNYVRSIVTVHGQITIDEFLYKEVVAKNGWWANKHSLSIGIAAHPKFNEKTNSTVSLSYSHSRPYTYTHSDSLQSFTNGAFSLAHFLGSNYRSLEANIYVITHKWGIRSNFTFFRHGDMTNLNDGTNPTLSNTSRQADYGNSIAQNSSGINHFIQTRVFYYLDKKNSFFIEHQAHDKHHAIGLGYRYSLNSSVRKFF